MRYARQEMLREIGKIGQNKLGNSTVAIVGIGALGTVSCELLARAGIGKLILIDRDIVELSNLQRQGMFEENDLGMPKALAAFRHLKKINSSVRIDFFTQDLEFKNTERTLGNNLDLILDCTDNLETRFLINDFSIKHKLPFIYSCAAGTRGYVFNVMPGKSACLRCFLKESINSDNCETLGVLNSTTHLISSLQVSEAIKILLKKGYEKKLLFMNLWNNNLSKLDVKKKKECVCCSGMYFEYLDGKKSTGIIKLCGNDIYQITSGEITKKDCIVMKKKLKKIGNVRDFNYCFTFEDRITVFQNGRALIKAKNVREAKSFYSRFVGN